MNILNCSHPLTSLQQDQIRQALGGAELAVTEVAIHFDTEREFAPQVASLLQATGISSQSWQTEPWLVVLPALNFIAAILLTELHGRMGHFPTIIRFKPVATPLGTTYELAEIINLDQVREEARKQRY